MDQVELKCPCDDVRSPTGSRLPPVEYLGAGSTLDSAASGTRMVRGGGGSAAAGSCGCCCCGGGGGAAAAA